ncbi:hypothetical protein SCP_0311860 [Sparassis crispa]|uniref:Uncharacterized protein n=1 Tax=Sparassis crispa TaxID=139825 RepID=A0A401GGZ7_9APHY|nr:hypothetical protein SCP_0311860 [Sparassis crispa]GBE81457.1 hypothetical protein SCP_0311860 [Sparassis crispa]
MRSTIAITAILVAASAAPALAIPIAPASGSEAVDWKQVGSVAGDLGKALFHILREEDPILARAFEAELVARADGSQALNWKSIGDDFKDFGEGVISRAEPSSEAIDWNTVGKIAGDVGRVAMHVLREEELLARGLAWDELD